MVLLSWCAESQECLLVIRQEEAGIGLGKGNAINRVDRDRGSGEKK